MSMNFDNPYDPLAKFLGCALGGAVGNALALPLTGMTACDIRSRVGEVRDFISPSSSPPIQSDWERGSWTGDIALFLGTLTAISEADGTIDIEKIGQEHMAVFEDGKRGLGRSTRNACKRHRDGRPWKEAGEPWDPARKSGAGNNVMVKIPPLGLLQSHVHKNVYTFIDEAIQYAMMTHLGPPAIVAGVIHAATIASLVHVQGPEVSVRWFFGDILRKIALEIERKLEVEYKLPLCEDKISSQLGTIIKLIDEDRLKRAAPEDISLGFGGGSAYAYHSFGFTYALFARYFERLLEYRDHPFDPVLWALNAGGSTEMNAAIMGELVGTVHGVNALPLHLVLGVEKSTEIVQLTEQFSEVCKNKAERKEWGQNPFYQSFSQYF